MAERGNDVSSSLSKRHLGEESGASLVIGAIFAPSDRSDVCSVFVEIRHRRLSCACSTAMVSSLILCLTFRREFIDHNNHERRLLKVWCAYVWEQEVHVRTRGVFLRQNIFWYLPNRWCQSVTLALDDEGPKHSSMRNNLPQGDFLCIEISSAENSCWRKDFVSVASDYRWSSTIAPTRYLERSRLVYVLMW